MTLRTFARLSACLLPLAGILSAPAQHKSVAAVADSTQPPLLLGAAWYPEQWPESRWDADLTLMEKAHLHMVRIGEFAWTAMEPSEGNYQLDWLERAINMAARHNIKVVLGTPTAGVPVWMEMKYPDVILTDSNGVHTLGTTRNHNNWNSAHMLQFTREIDEKLAQRFGHNPNVIGWQLDNELPHQSFDADAQAQFHQWLRVRYGTIDKLNAAWTTAYDNQTYSSFDEVPLMEGGRGNNPGIQLDSKRFITDSLVTFFRVQIDAIHKYALASQRITTNFMGWYDYFDHYPVAQELDLVSIDNPQVEGSFEPIPNGSIHDEVRGMKDANYWVMETTAGPRGGGNASVQLPKGAMRAAVWADVGHGADLVSYWQWRDALNGGEANHGALVDVDGEPDPIYTEWAQVGAEFEKAGAALENTHVTASVAILHNYPSAWDIDWARMNPKYEYLKAVMSYYTPLHQLGYTIDIVPPSRDLSHYKLVIAPALEQLTQEEADNLKHYVQGGGHLVLGQRSAMKDINNSRWPERQPGPLVPLLGARVEQYTALDKPMDLSGVWGNAQCELFAEQLQTQAPDVTVLMTYHAPHSWWDGQPAAVSRKVGSGEFVYVGAWLDEPATKREVQWLLDRSGAQPDSFAVPAGVDVYKRTGNGHDVFIVENVTGKSQNIALPAEMKDELNGNTTRAITLPVYGVAVVSRAH